MDTLERLRYPIGREVLTAEPLDPAVRASSLAALEETPARFRALADGLSDRDLDRPYRPDGWTVRQVFHHVADSHMHAYLRTKWAMAEDAPTVKTYDEVRWADLRDAKTAPIGISLALLEGLHGRWVAFLRALEPADWRRVLHHPERGIVTIDDILTIYSWHGRHHAAHIANAIGRTR